MKSKIYSVKNIFLLFFSSVFIVGCLQVHTTIDLKKDGSGAITEEVLFSNEVVSYIQEFSKSFTDSTSKSEEMTLYNIPQLYKDAKNWGEGVSYHSVENIKTDSLQGYKVVYYFKDINKVKISQDVNSKVSMSDTSAKKKSLPYAQFKFVKGTPYVLYISITPEKSPEEQNVNNKSKTSDTTNQNFAMMESFIDMFKKIKISLDMNFDGNIIETNATNYNNSKVTLFNIEFAKFLDIPEKLEEFKSIKPDNLTEIEQIIKDIPGIQIETKNELVVKF